MKMPADILEKLFKDFTNFILAKDGQPFVAFNSSKYFAQQEKYKETIYEDARETIRNGRWKSDDIGTGRIHQTVSDAIKTKVETTIT